jgi:hypothetical protein
VELPRDFRFDFTVEDYVQYNLDHDARTGQSRKLYRMIAVMLGMAIGVAVLVSSLISADRVATLRSGGAGLAVVLLVVLMLYQSRLKSIAQMTRKVVGDPEGGSALVGERRVVFDESGIRCELPLQTHEIRWAAICRVSRGPDHLYLYFTPLQAVILPRRCFKTDSEFEAFAASVEARLKGSA